jgi:hypothetical protein
MQTLLDQILDGTQIKYGLCPCISHCLARKMSFSKENAQLKMASSANMVTCSYSIQISNLNIARLWDVTTLMSWPLPSLLQTSFICSSHFTFFSHLPIAQWAV